jgi:DNA repair protein RadD
MPDLRPYQVRAVDAVRRLIRDGSRAPLLVAPTGAGKTVIMAHIVASAVAKGRRVAVVAHRRELIQQIDAAMRSVDLDAGIIAPWARPNPFARVQVGSVQTMVRRDVLPPADLLIIDEAHHTRLDNQWGQVVDMLRPRHVLGLTATPVRTDGQGLGVEAGGLYDAMEVVTSTAELVEQGYLARPVVYAPAVLPSLAGLRVERGDYSKGQAAAAMGTAKLLGDAVAHYQRLCPGARAAAFAVSLEHARTVADAFLGAGIPSEVIDGQVGPFERREILDRFRSGTTRVLVSCDLIGEGFDLPAIEAAILLRPTISTALYLQQVGRALRPAPGKDRATILDHAGNTIRHGLPTDDREWSLMGEEEGAAGKRRKADPDAAPVWQCQACYAYSPRAADACEGCGEARPYYGREVEVQTGELVEIQQAPRRSDPERGKARTLEALERIEKERGYKPGWARHVFAARQRKAGG